MLKKIRNLFITPAVLVMMTAGTAGALPAAADHSNGQASGNRAALAAATVASTESANTGSADTSGSSDPADTNSNQANALVQSLQAKHKKPQTAVARQRKCQAAKHGLETKLTNLQKNAAKHKALIDSIYSKTLAYQQQNNLNPANFDTLKASADAAQTKAADSVSALDNLSVNLDCSNASVATNVANFKVAAQQARSDLLAYRQAVVSVIQALQSSKQQ